VVKGDFMAVFADFHSHGKFVKSIILRSSLSFLSSMGPRRSKTSAQLALWVVSTRLF
jgi:hypothetical protein